MINNSLINCGYVIKFEGYTIDFKQIKIQYNEINRFLDIKSIHISFRTTYIIRSNFDDYLVCSQDNKIF